MAKVKLICGKIGSGKSWYARRSIAAFGGLLFKGLAGFEEPSPDDMAVWFENRRADGYGGIPDQSKNQHSAFIEMLVITARIRRLLYTGLNNVYGAFSIHDRCHVVRLKKKPRCFATPWFLLFYVHRSIG